MVTRVTTYIHIYMVILRLVSVSSFADEQGLSVVIQGWPLHLLERLLVLLDLDHDVMDVDEFAAYGQSLVWVLGEDLLEPVVVLDELAQGKL